mgnify:FL=1
MRSGLCNLRNLAVAEATAHLNNIPDIGHRYNLQPDSTLSVLRPARPSNIFKPSVYNTHQTKEPDCM